MATLSFEALAQRALAAPCPHPVRLIGVDGGAGAGKTTFAARLAEQLGGASSIPMDDFGAWDDLGGYWPRFEAQVLQPLFQGKGVRYQKRDWVNDMAGRGLDEWRELPFSPLLILEGIGATRRELSGRLSYAIWIEAPTGLRLQRGLTRDAGLPGIEQMWDGFMPFEARHFADDGAKGRADLLVDGAQPYQDEGKAFYLLEGR